MKPLSRRYSVTKLNPSCRSCSVTQANRPRVTSQHRVNHEPIPPPPPPTKKKKKIDKKKYMNTDCLSGFQQDISITGSPRSRRAPSCSLTQHISQRTLGSCVSVLSPPNYGKQRWPGKSRYLLCPLQIIKVRLYYPNSE